MNELIHYEVGASLRRELLDEENPRRDWVIPGATAETLLSQGFEQTDFVGHAFSNGSADRFFTAAIEMPLTGKRPHVQPMAAASLDQDLARRDLTINALARGPDGTIIDPHGGLEDLETGLLRHVSPAFSDDPMRLLRAARLTAQYAHFGFRLAHGTFGLMKAMVSDTRLSELPEQMVREELNTALVTRRPSRFFETLHRCGALTVIFPEISLAAGNSASHQGDTDSPALQPLDQMVNDGKAARLSVISNTFGESFVSRWMPK